MPAASRLDAAYVHQMLLCALATMLLATCCSGSYLYGQSMSENECFSALYESYLPKTIAILSEQPYSIAKNRAPVLLLAVPQDRLNVVQDVPTHPVVSLHTSTPQQLHGMIPAVRVFLHRPMMVSSPESIISFPSGFTVVHDGLHVPLAVSAVIAPLPSGTYFTADHPVAIRVVYALSVSPLDVQFSLPGSAPAPIAVTTASPVTSSLIPSEVSPSLPQQTMPQYPGSDDSNLVVEGGRPGGDVVITILDFPAAVASPSVNFFPQVSLDEGSELGNREPPQAAVPAGIVQSTAPLPNLSVFVNSKESSVLQALRDEAQRNKTQQQVEPTSAVQDISK